MKFLSFNHFLLLMLVVVTWGAHASIIKIALGEIGPYHLTFLRCFFTALAFSPFIKRISKQDLLRIFYVSFAFVTLHYSFMYQAINYINSSSYVVLAMLAMPITIILSALFLGEKFGLFTTLGIIVSFSGLFVAFGFPDVQSYPVGAVLSIITAFLWACGSLLMRRTHHIPKATFTFYLFLFALPFVFPVALVTEGNVITAMGQANGIVLASSLFYQVVVMGVMVAVWGKLIGENRAEFVTPFLLLQIPVAAIFGAWLLDEKIGETFVLSSFLIVLGIGIIHTRKIYKTAMRQK